MKYHIRFFLDNGKAMAEQSCFATVDSKHVPADGDLVYLGDEVLDDKHEVGIETGIIYQVKERVFCFNHYGEKDDLSTVEISVTRTTK